MQMGKYVRWEPLTIPECPVYCEVLRDDYEGFRVLLNGESRTTRTIRVTFEAPLMYQVRGEWFQLAPQTHALGLEPGYPFYVVEDSPLLVEFHLASLGIYQTWHINHYAIYTATDCIDVLSTVPPKVEILGSDPFLIND